MRVGHGYDVHRLKSGENLILGGVKIPFELGLLGHSDADVLIHAIIDALLGAAAIGDIGRLFPDSEAEFKGIDSRKLLSAVLGRLEACGYMVSNIDSTIIAQAPKLSPFIERMRENIAQTLQIPVDRVSIKATTEEFLGFTGAGQGIAAHAVVLLEEQKTV